MTPKNGGLTTTPPYVEITSLNSLQNVFILLPFLALSEGQIFKYLSYLTNFKTKYLGFCWRIMLSQYLKPCYV